jgi:hypothetical protein
MSDLMDIASAAALAVVIWYAIKPYHKAVEETKAKNRRRAMSEQRRAA